MARYNPDPKLNRKGIQLPSHRKFTWYSEHFQMATKLNALHVIKNVHINSLCVCIQWRKLFKNYGLPLPFFVHACALLCVPMQFFAFLSFQRIPVCSSTDQKAVLNWFLLMSWGWFWGSSPDWDWNRYPWAHWASGYIQVRISRKISEKNVQSKQHVFLLAILCPLVYLCVCTLGSSAFL